MVHHPQGLTMNGPYKASQMVYWFMIGFTGLPQYGWTDLKSRIWGITHMISICFVTLCEIVRLFYANCSMSWWLNPLDRRDTPEGQLVVSSSGFNGGKVSWDDAEAGPGTWTSSSLGLSEDLVEPKFSSEIWLCFHGETIDVGSPILRNIKLWMPKDPKDEREAGTWRPPVNMFFFDWSWQTLAVPSRSFRL